MYLLGANNTIEGKASLGKLKTYFIDGRGDVDGEYYAGNSHTTSVAASSHTSWSDSGSTSMQDYGTYFKYSTPQTSKYTQYLSLKYSKTESTSSSTYGAGGSATAYGYRGYFYDGESGFYMVGATTERAEESGGISTRR